MRVHSHVKINESRFILVERSPRQSPITAGAGSTLSESFRIDSGVLFTVSADVSYTRPVELHADIMDSGTLARCLLQKRFCWTARLLPTTGGTAAAATTIAMFRIVSGGSVMVAPQKVQKSPAHLLSVVDAGGLARFLLGLLIEHHDGLTSRLPLSKLEARWSSFLPLACSALHFVHAAAGSDCTSVWHCLAANSCGYSACHCLCLQSRFVWTGLRDNSPKVQLADDRTLDKQADGI